MVNVNCMEQSISEWSEDFDLVSVQIMILLFIGQQPEAHRHIQNTDTNILI